MKFCPYCDGKIPYVVLLFYNAWYKSTKHDECLHCDATYKITVYLLFKILIFSICASVLLFLFIGPGRVENRTFVLYILAIVSFILIPIVPFFIKLSEEK